MITKDPKEIEVLKKSGQILAAVLNLVAGKAKAGVTAKDLDILAEKEIILRGAKPSFKGYFAQPGDPPFPASLCVSINHEVVHGIPTTDKILKDGDIVGLDLGVEYHGIFTDAAITVPVGIVDPEKLKLIAAAKEALAAGLAQIKPGNFTGDVGHAMEEVAAKYGFQVVRELVGHGVGKAVHEDPEVPGFGSPKTGTKFKLGQVLAVEPMVNLGGWKINFAPDRWTIITADGSPSAHIEHTVIVTNQGCEIVTKV